MVRSATVPCFSLIFLLISKAGFCTAIAITVPIIKGNSTPRHSFNVIYSNSVIINKYADSNKNFFFLSFSVKILLSVDFYVKMIYNKLKLYFGGVQK